MPKEGTSSALSAVSSRSRKSAASRGNWRDVVLDPSYAGSERSSSPSRRAPAPSPASRTWILILTHCLDLIALLLLGGATALLRFGDIYLIRPLLVGVGGLCGREEYAQRRRNPAISVPPYVVDLLAILAPILLIGLLEMTLAIALRRNINRARDSAWVFFAKRFAKLTLVFLLGLCLTSLVTDLIRLLVSRPRPYFLADNTFGFGFARYCDPDVDEDVNIGLEERDARLSFPSYHCSMLAYSGAVVAIHAERVLRHLHLGGMYVLRALSALLASVPALLLASQALDSRSNHWEDVVVGLLLGAVLAAYTELVLGRDLNAQVMTVAAIPVKVPVFGVPSHSLPRVRVDSHVHGLSPVPPPLTTAELAAHTAYEASKGLGQRSSTHLKPDHAFY